MSTDTTTAESSLEAGNAGTTSGLNSVDTPPFKRASYLGIVAWTKETLPLTTSATKLDNKIQSRPNVGTTETTKNNAKVTQPGHISVAEFGHTRINPEFIVSQRGTDDTDDDNSGDLTVFVTTTHAVNRNHNDSDKEVTDNFVKDDTQNSSSIVETKSTTVVSHSQDSSQEPRTISTESAAAQPTVTANVVNDAISEYTKDVFSIKSTVNIRDNHGYSSRPIKGVLPLDQDTESTTRDMYGRELTDSFNGMKSTSVVGSTVSSNTNANSGIKDLDKTEYTTLSNVIEPDPGDGDAITHIQEIVSDWRPTSATEGWGVLSSTRDTQKTIFSETKLSTEIYDITKRLEVNNMDITVMNSVSTSPSSGGNNVKEIFAEPMTTKGIERNREVSTTTTATTTDVDSLRHHPSVDVDDSNPEGITSKALNVGYFTDDSSQVSDANSGDTRVSNSKDDTISSRVMSGVDKNAIGITRDSTFGITTTLDLQDNNVDGTKGSDVQGYIRDGITVSYVEEVTADGIISENHNTFVNDKASDTKDITVGIVSVSAVQDNGIDTTVFSYVENSGVGSTQPLAIEDKGIANTQLSDIEDNDVGNTQHLDTSDNSVSNTETSDESGSASTASTQLSDVENNGVGSTQSYDFEDNDGSSTKPLGVVDNGIGSTQHLGVEVNGAESTQLPDVGNIDSGYKQPVNFVDNGVDSTTHLGVENNGVGNTRYSGAGDNGVDNTQPSDVENNGIEITQSLFVEDNGMNSTQSAYVEDNGFNSTKHSNIEDINIERTQPSVIQDNSVGSTLLSDFEGNDVGNTQPPDVENNTVGNTKISNVDKYIIASTQSTDNVEDKNIGIDVIQYSNLEDNGVSSTKALGFKDYVVEVTEPLDIEDDSIANTDLSEGSLGILDKSYSTKMADNLDNTGILAIAESRINEADEITEDTTTNVFKTTHGTFTGDVNYYSEMISLHVDEEGRSESSDLTSYSLESTSFSNVKDYTTESVEDSNMEIESAGRKKSMTATAKYQEDISPLGQTTSNTKEMGTVVPPEPPDIKQTTVIYTDIEWTSTITDSVFPATDIPDRDDTADVRRTSNKSDTVDIIDGVNITDDGNNSVTIETSRNEVEAKWTTAIPDGVLPTTDDSYAEATDLPVTPHNIKNAGYVDDADTADFEWTTVKVDDASDVTDDPHSDIGILNKSHSTKIADNVHSTDGWNRFVTREAITDTAGNEWTTHFPGDTLAYRDNPDREGVTDTPDKSHRTMGDNLNDTGTTVESNIFGATETIKNERRESKENTTTGNVLRTTLGKLIAKYSTRTYSSHHNKSTDTKKNLEAVTFETVTKDPNKQDAKVTTVDTARSDFTQNVVSPVLLSSRESFGDDTKKTETTATIDTTANTIDSVDTDNITPYDLTGKDTRDGNLKVVDSTQREFATDVDTAADDNVKVSYSADVEQTMEAETTSSPVDGVTMTDQVTTPTVSVTTEEDVEYVYRNTSQERIKGVVVDTSLGIQVERFLGIPYAVPPVGQRRFSDPVLYGNFKTVPYQAVSHGPACIQFSDLRPNPYSRVGQVDLNTSEDCLYLNLWTPHNNTELKPVVVYIHGGSNIVGSGSEDLYDGTYLAAIGNVVVITFNYRLNLFGLFHPGVNDADVTGNQGLKDQALVLRWMRENIEEYGGDPGNVTLFGEISGATQALLHLLSPDTQHLFNRLILQSALDLVPGDFERPQPNNQVYKNRIPGITQCLRTANIVQCLRNVSTDQLVEALRHNPLQYRPVIDDKYITASLWEMLEKATLTDHDVIIGVNQMDAVLIMDSYIEFFVRELRIYRNVIEYHQTECPRWFLRSGVTSLTPPSDICSAVKTQNLTTEEDIMLAISQIWGDLHITCPAEQIARKLAEKMPYSKVYMYQLTYQAQQNPYPSWWGVPVTAELQWVFGALFKLENYHNYPDDERELSRDVINMWSSFAKTGLPDGSSSTVRWTPYRVRQGHSSSTVHPAYLQINGWRDYVLHENVSIHSEFCNILNYSKQ